MFKPAKKETKKEVKKPKEEKPKPTASGLEIKPPVVNVKQE